MSAPTPRTDAAWSASFSPENQGGRVVDLARTLERELDALTAERDQLRAEVAKLRVENNRLRSTLQHMLDVAENADETGYVTDAGFVDLDKLHAEVRVILANGAGQPRARGAT